MLALQEYSFEELHEGILPKTSKDCRRSVRRTWGFRFSLTDAAALTTFGAAAIARSWLDSSFWWLLAIVAGHFFLFRDVFRVVRRRELIWVAFFVLNVGSWLLWGRLDRLHVLACQLPLSVGVIAREIKATRYHGIFAGRLSPALDDYLEGRIP